MQPSYNILKSRTFWTVIAMFVIAGGNAIIPVIPPAFQTILQGLLGVAAIYFHVNPSQNYTASTSPTPGQ